MFRFSIYAKNLLFALIGALIFSAPVWAQETDNPAFAIEESPVSESDVQGGALYYLGDGAVEEDGNLTLNAKAFPPMHVEEGEPGKAGWYQIGKAGGSEMVFFYYPEVWMSTPAGADPDTACKRGPLKPHVGGYTIKVIYDNDGSVLHNASYTDDYWYGPWYSNKTPSERWVFCGSPRITVKPPFRQKQVSGRNLYAFV